MILEPFHYRFNGFIVLVVTGIQLLLYESYKDDIDRVTVDCNCYRNTFKKYCAGTEVDSNMCPLVDKFST